MLSEYKIQFIYIFLEWIQLVWTVTLVRWISSPSTINSHNRYFILIQYLYWEVSIWGFNASIMSMTYRVIGMGRFRLMLLPFCSRMKASYEPIKTILSARPWLFRSDRSNWIGRLQHWGMNNVGCVGVVWWLLWWEALLMVRNRLVGGLWWRWWDEMVMYCFCVYWNIMGAFRPTIQWYLVWCW